MNRVEIKGLAEVKSYVKFDTDGGVDYATVEIEGKRIEEYLGSLLMDKQPDEVKSSVTVRAIAKVSIVIEPLDTGLNVIRAEMAGTAGDQES